MLQSNIAPSSNQGLTVQAEAMLIQQLEDQLAKYQELVRALKQLALDNGESIQRERIHRYRQEIQQVFLQLQALTKELLSTVKTNEGRQLLAHPVIAEIVAETKRFQHTKARLQKPVTEITLHQHLDDMINQGKDFIFTGTLLEDAYHHKEHQEWLLTQLDALKKKKIFHIQLTDNQLTDWIFPAITIPAIKNKGLQELRLARNKLTDVSLKTLSLQEVIACSSLKKLDLRGNLFLEKGVAFWICSVFARTEEPYPVLSLSQNPGFPDAFASILEDAHLGLSSNELLPMIDKNFLVAFLKEYKVKLGLQFFDKKKHHPLVQLLEFIDTQSNKSWPKSLCKIKIAQGYFSQHFSYKNNQFVGKKEDSLADSLLNSLNASILGAPPKNIK
jgi:hypothetical protein